MSVTACDQILDCVPADAVFSVVGALSVFVLAKAGQLSRSGYFYQFPDKSDLAQAALNRCVRVGGEGFMELFAQVKAISKGPVERLLTELQLISLRLEEAEPIPGCLVAAARYQDRLFDAMLREENRKATLFAGKPR